MDYKGSGLQERIPFSLMKNFGGVISSISPIFHSARARARARATEHSVALSLFCTVTVKRYIQGALSYSYKLQCCISSLVPDIDP